MLGRLLLSVLASLFLVTASCDRGGPEETAEDKIDAFVPVPENGDSTGNDTIGAK